MLHQYRIHYIESGDGKRINGHIYNGKRRIDISASTPEKAIARLRQQYIKNGIKEIEKVELLEN